MYTLLKKLSGTHSRLSSHVELARARAALEFTQYGVTELSSYISHDTNLTPKLGWVHQFKIIHFHPPKQIHWGSHLLYFPQWDTEGPKIRVGPPTSKNDLDV